MCLPPKGTEVLHEGAALVAKLLLRKKKSFFFSRVFGMCLPGTGTGVLHDGVGGKTAALC